MPRPRPRPRKRQPVKSRLRPCVYSADRTLPDPAAPDPTADDAYLCRCGLARTHVRHELPDTAEADAEHRRRYGDDG